MENIRSALPTDAESCLHIYEPYVSGSTISFEWSAPSLSEYKARLSEIIKKFPILVFEDEGKIFGFAYATSFRSRAAYQWCVETSVYVTEGQHRSGIAKKLYLNLFEQLKNTGFVNAYAVISLPNEKSVKFHESFGFSKNALFEKVGFKNGLWVDVGFWYKNIQEDHPKIPKFLNL
jgi:L-amino acid N-acyltransferase YncA